MRFRWCIDPEPAGNDRHATHVFVAFGRGQRSFSVFLVCAQEAVDLGDVHPTQQMGVVG